MVVAGVVGMVGIVVVEVGGTNVGWGGGWIVRFVDVIGRGGGGAVRSGCSG